MREIIYPIEYLNIIANAVRRGLTKKTAKQLGIGGHVHHIIPKCVAPELEKEKYNIVFLTYEEHYIVHKLLAEANPKDRIACAWSCMHKHKEIDVFFTAEDYAKAMELTSIVMSKTMSGENSPNFGRKASDETIKKIRENHADVSGKNHPHFGKPKYKGAGRPDKPVINEEHGIIFKSIAAAERESFLYGFTHVCGANIRKCLKKPSLSCGKDAEGNPLHWRELK